MFKKFWNKSNIVSSNLHYYDRFVNQFNCKYVWKCSPDKIFNIYNQNCSKYHLEIGPGTGYFLKNSNLNSTIHELTLIDINDQILDYSMKNLKSEYSNINALNYNLFTDKIPDHIKFDSVGINYVLHCIPGDLQKKIDTLIHNLGDNNYKLFASTVICDPLHISIIAEYELMLLNSLGIFNNNNDTYQELQEYLENNKFKYNLHKEGYVAILEINTNKLL